MSRLRPDRMQGVYLGDTRGRAVPRNNRRGCLCPDENRYSIRVIRRRFKRKKLV